MGAGDGDEADSEDKEDANDEENELAEPEVLNKIVRNEATKYCHVLTDGRLVCGKPLPQRHTLFDEPPVDARWCSKCV